MMSVGATTAWNFKHMIDDDDSGNDSDDEASQEDDDDAAVREFLADMDDPFSADIDLDKFMVSAVHVKKNRSVQAEHLSKIWRIDLEAAQKTLDITSQNCNRTKSDNLSRNYATNDKMLRYKRIKEFFFMDTFYATKKAGKSSRGNSCCQLFVTDKGFIYVVPMKKESEVLQAVK
jgi:hypothetical protein